MWKPYLSIIIICRNDDYKRRFDVAINNLIIQAKKYNLRAELIIVEWNPPSDRPLLKDALSLPDDLGPLAIRFIVVPNSIHKTYKPSDKLKVIYPPAINIGVRRAQGEFILMINSDVLLSNELFHFLSLEKLEKNRFYRTFRYNVHKDVLKYSCLEKRLDFCEKNIVQAFRETEISPHGLAEHPILQTACGVDFIVFSKEYWYLLHGWPEVSNLATDADALICYMAYLAGLKEELLDDPMRLYHIDHDSTWRPLTKQRAYYFVKNRICERLDYYNKMRVLLRRIYIFKDKVSDFFVNIFYHLFGTFLKRISSAGTRDFDTRYLAFEQRKILVGMLKGKRSYIYNDNSWGFPNENFKEYEANK